MQLSGRVDKPQGELAARPVTGLDCGRDEQSGRKFWGLIRDIFGNRPEDFFQRNFVHNLCPLAFFAASGRNITPAELRVCLIVIAVYMWITIFKSNISFDFLILIHILITV